MTHRSKKPLLLLAAGLAVLVILPAMTAGWPWWGRAALFIGLLPLGIWWWSSLDRAGFHEDEKP